MEFLLFTFDLVSSRFVEMSYSNNSFLYNHSLKIMAAYFPCQFTHLLFIFALLHWLLLAVFRGSAGNKHLCFSLSFREKPLNTSLMNTLFVGGFCRCSTRLKKVPSIPSVLKVFTLGGC